MDPQDAAKQAAAQAACAYVETGMTVGLGTGSTADFAVRHLADRMKSEGLRIRGIPTSLRTETLARDLGLPLATLDEVGSIDVTIDGADEVDPKLDLIKGLGGALLREKVVASITKRQIIVVDPSKIVPRLGTRSPLPVEVLPFGVKVVERKLVAQGYQPTLRVKDGKPVVTDNGNLVLDTRFPQGIHDARALEAQLNNIPGVVENGFFLGMTWKVVVGEAGGRIHERSS
jgi:ribose 5-phosphate isomerase A